MSGKRCRTSAAAIVVLAAGCGGGDGGPDDGSGATARLTLSVAEQTVLEAFGCFPTAAEQPREHAVLLVHGTELTAAESWNDTYAAVLPQAGYNTCTIRLPNRSLDDIQVSSEYVVAAVRRMRRDFGGGVDLVGHSQRGLEVRWAIK